MTHPTAVVTERASESSGPLTITCVNPLEHAAAIKRLFLTHARPEFPAFFDRAYPDAVAAGARSWIGTDAHGQLRAHIMQMPHEFALGSRTVRGALLANLMVAVPYRTFWPGLALVRQAVKDTRQSGIVDFLYADPNDAAHAILRAAGLRDVGSLRRFVLPLGDGRLGIELALRIYLWVRQVSIRARTLHVTERRGHEGAPLALGRTRSLQPVRPHALYRARLGEYPGPQDCWYTMHAGDSPTAAVGEALVRGPTALGVATICGLQWESTSDLGAALISLARRVRQAGATRLELSVMAGSSAAREVRRAGFLPRADQLPVMAMPLTPLGVETVRGAADWRLLPIDLDR